MHQNKYTSNLLDELKCSHLSAAATHLDPSIKLFIDQGDLLPDPSLYRRLVGKLNFLQYTKPALFSSAFKSVPTVSQGPAYDGWFTCFEILNVCPTQGILLTNSPNLSLIAFSDSDWATGTFSRRSVTSYFITLGGCPISWKSKKQPTISLSSAEAEYRVLRKVVAEISWLVRLLNDLDLSITTHVPVFCDSQAALHIAKNLIFHKRIKHIEVDCHYVRDCLSYGLVSLQFMHSFDQLTDIMTKALYGPLHHTILGKPGVF
uniref:Uncharacterized mitochondrial protein AtMg00810-like n=1 Tax=Nicotiana tabacum TaxID=4097 RepID=A0A1S4BN11_TOBAC|nr:PREDICTED: uncharacterized mitochondrial protein AtMg00810-like [Nicotiana tabacum]